MVSPHASLPPSEYKMGRPDSSYHGRQKPGRPKHLGRRSRRRWWWLVVVPGVVVVFFGWSVLGAYSTPGNESFSAKWADWLRAHHAGYVVNHAEAYYYAHHAPPKGGAPSALNSLPAPGPTGPLAPPKAPTAAAPPSAAAPAAVGARALAAPGPVPLVVRPALPGEGQWQPVGPRIAGQPGLYEAQFRADTVYTGEITTAVWVDLRLVKLALIPGLNEPGGTWPHPPYITAAEQPSVLAAFNGGFRFQDAKGGFYLDGRTAVALRSGAASLVIYQNGSVNVGVWDADVTMAPDVVAVLQNLVPLVYAGQVAASATYNDTRVWGSTLGASVVVARSGVGVTAAGALIYVAGPALTAKTLAESLQRAGAVRAMTLDINPEWVTFNFYSHPNPAHPDQIAPSKLYPQMQRPADRYLGPTPESRDFFTLSL